MADLFSITAPLMIRFPSGEKRIIAEHFPHPKGLLYFDLFWHLGYPDDTIHIIEGEITGEGPWKAGSHVINVLGCYGSDPELAVEFSQWQDYLQQSGSDYPAQPMIEAIARQYGGLVAELK